MVKTKRSWWRRLLGAALLASAAFLLGSALLVLTLRFVPPPISALRIERRIQSWFSSETYASRSNWVALEDIAPCMGLAVIAGEDQNFPEHSGFDWKAIEKAVAHNERSRRKRGASTVSQQTAKNLFLWSSRSWVRKGFEVYFTALIELGWPKQRILETYLNIVEFGDGLYGVEAASQAYFRKPAKRLRPSEAALLAAVLPNPHRFKVNAPSPYILGRQAWILKQMQQLGGDQLIRELGN
jgi:monofunctional biosynthetic peptidoglycan transglycosylase